MNVNTVTLFVCSLIMIIILCSILSVILYPSNLKERFSDISLPLALQTLLMMVKMYSYDFHGLQFFYKFGSFSNYMYTGSLPIFYTIAKPCTTRNFISAYKCYDYNINNMTTNVRSVGMGTIACSSIDNVFSPSDALAFTVRIADDVFFFSKSCVQAPLLTLMTESNVSVSVPASIRTYDEETILAKGEQSNEEIYHLSRLSIAAKRELNKKYTLKINDAALSKTIVLLRPLFIRIGASLLYRIDYTVTDSSTNNINSYNSSVDNGHLTLALIPVFDKRMYSIQAETLFNVFISAQTHDRLKKIDCKSKNILDASFDPLKALYGTEITEEEQRTEIDITLPISVGDMSIILYYLKHVQSLEKVENPTTSSISMYFQNIPFSYNEALLFQYQTSYTIVQDETLTQNYQTFSITTQQLSGIKRITLKKFGNASDLTFDIPSSNTTNICLTVIWSQDRLTTAITYTTAAIQTLQVSSVQVTNPCNITNHMAFNMLCESMKCTLPNGKPNCCLTTLYDVIGNVANV